MDEGPKRKKTPKTRIAELTRRLDDITRMISDLVWEVDAELRFIAISDRIFDVTGLIPHRFIGTGIGDVGRFADIEADALAGRFRHPFQGETFHLTKEDGTELTFLLNSLPVFDTKSGAFIGALGTAEDVTDRLDKERTIKASESRYRRLVESAPFAVLVVVDGTIRFANAPAIKLFAAKSMDELIGIPAPELVQPSQRALLAPHRKRVIEATVRPETIDFTRVRLDGSEFESTNALTPIEWEGKPALHITIQDVSEIRRKERALHESEHFLRSIADLVPAFIAYHDTENRFRFANRYYRKIGFEPDALIGKNLIDIFGDEMMARVKPYVERALAGESVRYDNYVDDIKGERLHTQVSISPDFDDSGEIVGYIVLSADISERRRSEAETSNARVNLEKAQRMAQIGSWERDLRDETVYWSPEMYRIFDYNPDLVTPSHDKLFDRVHPDDRERVMQTQRSAIDDRAEHYTNEFRILRGDGSTRHIVGRGEIGYGDDGAAEGIIGTTQDVTAARRVQDALETAKREAENANRDKSEFLSSMSHELRTPMNAILGYAQLLLQNKKEPVSEIQQRQINQILKSGQHLLVLINDILDLSKIETGQVAFELSAMEAASAVEECIGLIAALAEENGLEIINHVKDRPPPPILADGIRLKQALLNLLSNAVKFNGPGGRVEVSARPLNAEFVRISISDTGIGIPEEKAAELFEPFGRLDAERRGIEGTGIGLTITKQLVERMNGSIGYSSKPGKGSTFWIDIPAAVPGASEDAATATGAGKLDLDADQDGARETVILYIEDDLSNRQLFKEVVGHLKGTKLLSAHSAEDGIQIARHILPNVIVMDVNLPGMSGLEAVRILREEPKTAAIPVIALSAAAMPGDIEKGERAGFFRYITKPFVVDEIIVTIGEALHKSTNGYRTGKRNKSEVDVSRNAAE